MNLRNFVVFSFLFLCTLVVRNGYFLKHKLTVLYFTHTALV